MSLLEPKYRYNLGYALSGGGAKGFAHLGALKVLEQHELKPDVIVGTSAGSLAGVFYADGFHPDEITELFRKKEFREFAEFTIPIAGFFKSSGLHTFLKNNLRAKTFEELQIPFISVATDWEKAKTVAFSEGKNLIDAVVASCTVPIVFHPVLIDDIAYVDGGLFKNFPVSVIRKDCKYVIGVNVSLMVPPAEKTNIKKIAERTFNLMSNSNTLPDRKLCDILIETAGLEKYTMFDLNNIEKISEIGRITADERMQENDAKRIVSRCLRYKELSEKITPYIKQVKRR
ncbi:MAG: patatin-like phospholipase family protein [Petrimonas sp.]|nr:patatin-like phospholipase family protein [Petrimonas sp.]